MSQPTPAIGQVWEDGYGGSYAGRRVRLDRPDNDVSAPEVATWRCIVTAYPALPRKVGTAIYLSGRTLRTKWRHIAEEQR